MYTTIGTYVINMTASNLVSSEITTLSVTVKEPIKITQFTQTVTYVKVENSVDFQVYYGGEAGVTVFWEVK